MITGFYKRLASNIWPFCSQNIALTPIFCRQHRSKDRRQQGAFSHRTNFSAYWYSWHSTYSHNNFTNFPFVLETSLEELISHLRYLLQLSEHKWSYITGTCSHRSCRMVCPAPLLCSQPRRAEIPGLYKEDSKPSLRSQPHLSPHLMS